MIMDHSNRALFAERSASAETRRATARSISTPAASKRQVDVDVDPQLALCPTSLVTADTTRASATWRTWDPTDTGDKSTSVTISTLCWHTSNESAVSQFMASESQLSVV
eukprot:CAMPEP_0175956552 /NCGR_PEP_ID=MMETSP0108-20121206/33145_1 /TAXON_ID=195067 ORGANISM="Goniomonas pacifica, Strain CCMP1869" /NCGR_SAMPLE_ID=MMETSP0108 /ASSEMBLY_ACC=CAM_ASM_000204 /LENGTH=108 /DNA_ID=CAMNT_0017283587 /DNA_START=117 /DNA_END=443 /DNA_ORIENTATION=+